MKKKIIIVIAVVLVALLVWLLVAFLNVNRPSDDGLTPEMTAPTASESTHYDMPFLKKIEVEYMDAAEKEKMNLGDDPTVRLQVLERDAEGNVTAYKKVTSDEEVVEYMYDPNPNPSNELIVAPLGQQ